MRRWTGLLLVFAAATVEGHDFWIEPSTFRPKRGELIAISLRVGQDFIGDPIVRSGSLIETFVARDPSGERRINGFENRDPAGYMHSVRPGVIVVGYRSKPSRVDLSAEAFARFLREEGFSPATPQAHTETFSRFAKAVLLSEGDIPANIDFGWRFEIVPESALSGAEPLRVRVVFEGKPLAGALVTAIHRDDPRARVALRTDRAGVATLPLQKDGVWLIKTVALISPRAGRKEWETLWASLTFER